MSNRVFQSLSRRLRRGQSGQTLVEYGLILALIALMGFVGVVSLQGGVMDLYDTVKQAADAMANALL